MALGTFLAWFLGIVVVIAVLIALFEISASSKKTAEKLEDIYNLLKEQNGRR